MVEAIHMRLVAACAGIEHNETMTSTTMRKKARAVLLAFVMVVSMFGAPMAFAGSAAAATNSVELSDNLVQGGEEITVNGTVDANGTVHAFIDVDGDGNYTGQTDISASVDVTNHNEDNSYSITLNAPSESGTYDVYVFQDKGETDSVIDEGDEGERSAELKVDADAPTFGNETPEDGSTVNQGDTDEIVIPIQDANTSVTQITATVQNADGTINTWEIDPNSAGGDGVEFTEGELIVKPGQGSVPDLADGSYDVSVKATDEVGNEGTLDFSFTVDSTNPTFSLNQPADGELTNDENQTVEVSVEPGNSDRSINDSTVTLTITDANDNVQTFDYTDDVYDNSTNTFTVNPSASEDIDSFSEGDVTVEVSAEDDVGNSAGDTFAFHVDTAGPEATGVQLSDADLNIEDVEDSNAETVTVTFNESVDPSSVSADVIIDGETVETLSFSESIDNDGNVVENEVVATLSASTYGAIENDSAVVNVTAAQDDAGNELVNPDADASQTTFAIDTDGPSVELSELPNDGTLSGYVNVTDFIASTDDATNTYVEVWVGQDASSNLDITGTADNVDTRNYPDGDHTIAVIVEDDSGNVDVATANFTLDNGQDLTIAQEYLSGAAVNPKVVGSDVNITDVFNAPAGADVTYTVVGEGEVTGDDLLLDADERRGETVTLQADYNGETRTVEVKFDPLQIDAGAGYNDDDEFIVVVASDKAPDELDTLNVSVESSDNYFESDGTELTREDFEETSEYPHPELEHVYVATVNDEELRDGEYSVTVEEASDGSQTVTGVDAGLIEVDNENPSIIDADIEGYNDHGDTVVNVRFSEPVDDLQKSDFVFADGRSEVLGVIGDSTEGEVNVIIEGEIQTGDDNATLEVAEGDYSEFFGEDGNVAGDSVYVDSAELDLSEGLNYVSVPIKAGEISLDELNKSGELDNVEVIWAYEDGKWVSYDPDADENNLTALEGGVGYVVKAESDTTVDVRGYTKVADSTGDGPTAPQMQTLEPGWNFIGHFQLGPQEVGTAVGGLTYDTDVGVLTQGSGDSLTYTNEMHAGEGYWIFVRESGLYTPVEDSGGTAGPTVSNTDVSAADTEPVTTGDTVTISTDAEFNAPKEIVYADVSAFSSAGLVQLTDGDGDGTYTAEVTVDKDGVESIEEVDVYAVDEFGQWDSDSDTIQVDSGDPTASVNSASPSPLQSSETVTINYDGDDANISEVRLIVTNPSGNEVLNRSVTAGTDVDEAVDLSNESLGTIEEGTYNVTVTTVDDAGNTNSDTMTDAFEVDDTPPAYESLSVNSSGTSSVNTTLNVTLNDSVSGLNASTIDASDFNVTNMSDSTDVSVIDVDVSNVDNAPATGNQTVILTLDDNYSNTQLEVKIEGGDGIDDNVGNTLNGSGEKTVTP